MTGYSDGQRLVVTGDTANLGPRSRHRHPTVTAGTTGTYQYARTIGGQPVIVLRVDDGGHRVTVPADRVQPAQPNPASGQPAAGRVWAYARVSTRDQNPQLQLDALQDSGYDELVTEKESGKRGAERPAWEELLPKPRAGDTLKFWKSDRWGRSAAHVLTTINQLRDRGIKVVSLTENFDLDTKEGRFMFAVLAAAAEYELELRAERQAEGIAAAQRRQAEGRMLPGKRHIGRPRAIGPGELVTLRRLVEDGVSVTEAARRLKIGRTTAYEALAAADPQADDRAELDSVLAALPADTRPAPSVAPYDRLLTRTPKVERD